MFRAHIRPDVDLRLLEERHAGAVFAVVDQNREYLREWLPWVDATVTEELEAEGWAKDRIRELQELRKSAGLDVSDRISVVMSVPAQRADWASTHRDLIAGEILATSFEFGEPVDGVQIGAGVRVAIAKT